MSLCQDRHQSFKGGIDENSSRVADLVNASTFRNFSWGDFPSLVAINGVIWGENQSDIPTDADDFVHWLKQPDLEPQKNCFVAEHRGRIVGFVVLVRETLIGRGIVDGGIHPEFRRRGIGGDLLRTVISWARTLPLTHLDIRMPGPIRSRYGVLEQEGFLRVRVHWRMRWQGDLMTRPLIPEGYVLHPLVPGEEALLTNIQNVSFRDTWGFCPNTVEQIRYRLDVTDTRPDGIIFLRHGQDVVGYNWTVIGESSPKRTGFIGMTGVAPSERGRGLGRVVVVAGMKHLLDQGARRIELTVDRDNVPARNLYLSVGFRRFQEAQWYRLSL